MPPLVRRALEVAAARARVRKRLADTPWRTNAEVPGPYLYSRRCFPSQPQKTPALKKALENGAISSMRGLAHVMQMAWTPTDLAAKPAPKPRRSTRHRSCTYRRPHPDPTSAPP